MDKIANQKPALKPNPCGLQCRKEGLNIVPRDYRRAEILILGSFPGKASRTANFYYAHPANRFWKVLSAVYNDPVGDSVDEKLAFLTRNRIALWDIAQSAQTEGSADTALQQIVPVPLVDTLKDTTITRVFCNGQKSFYELNKHYPTLGKDAVLLPSSSPANAAMGLDVLITRWAQAIKANKKDKS